jgi:hypothetical protein
MELVWRAVRTRMPTIDPHTVSVPKLPFALDRNRPGRVEVELQLVQADAYLDQLGATEEPKIQVCRHAMHEKNLNATTSGSRQQTAALFSLIGRFMIRPVRCVERQAGAILRQGRVSLRKHPDGLSLQVDRGRKISDLGTSGRKRINT